MLPNPVIVPVAMTGVLPGGVVPDMPLPPPQATRAAAAARRNVGILLVMTFHLIGMCCSSPAASRRVPVSAAVLSRPAWDSLRLVGDVHSIDTIAVTTE